MKHHCLDEQKLALLYYRELPDSDTAHRHLAQCALCTNRFTELTLDLDNLPQMSHNLDHAAATRMAARVSEQLNRPNRRWQPALGASAVTVFALMLVISLKVSTRDALQAPQFTTSAMTATNLSEEMPDIDFLEDLELLQEFELLSQIEGV